MPRLKLPCPDCSTPTRGGRRCQPCTTASRRAAAEIAYVDVRRSIGSRLAHEQAIAPPPLLDTNYNGSAIVIACLHIPFYSIPWVQKVCETAQLLHIDTLVLAGDVLMADRISRYDRVGAAPTIAEELLALSAVMTELSKVFKRIVFVCGNHDQRIEKQIAAAAETKLGRNTLDMVAATLGTTFDPDDMERLSKNFIESFLPPSTVTFEPLPQIMWNNTYLIMHAGCSRTPPAHERAMAAKHRRSVIAGNSHLWGAGFDVSGQDVCVTVGHSCEPERFRYIKEKPSSFPQQVRGMCVILVNERTGPAGAVLPLADHPRYASVADVAEALKPSLP